MSFYQNPLLIAPLRESSRRSPETSLLLKVYLLGKGGFWENLRFLKFFVQQTKCMKFLKIRKMQIRPSTVRKGRYNSLVGTVTTWSLNIEKAEVALNKEKAVLRENLRKHAAANERRDWRGNVRRRDKPPTLNSLSKFIMLTVTIARIIAMLHSFGNQNPAARKCNQLNLLLKEQTNSYNYEWIHSRSRKSEFRHGRKFFSAQNEVM